MDDCGPKSHGCTSSTITSSYHSRGDFSKSPPFWLSLIKILGAVSEKKLKTIKPSKIARFPNFPENRIENFLKKIDFSAVKSRNGLEMGEDEIF